MENKAIAAAVGIHSDRKRVSWSQLSYMNPLRPLLEVRSSNRGGSAKPLIRGCEAVTDLDVFVTCS